MPGIDSDVRYIKGIGEQRAKALSKLGIYTLSDLIRYFPRSYEDRSRITAISDAEPDSTVCINVTVISMPRLSMVRKGMELVKFRAVDDTGTVEVTFFNQSYVKNQIRMGENYCFYGKLTGSGQRRSMTNPLFESESNAGVITGRIVPVYRLTAGISQKTLINSIASGLEACGSQMPEPLPEPVRERYSLAQAEYAYRNIHFPNDAASLEIARRRLIFEEFFVLAVMLGQLKSKRNIAAGIKFKYCSPEEFCGGLPFSPTKAQQRAIAQIFADMTGGLAMNRLVQGDVGSGKTLVAAAAAWLCWKNGCQSAFMAPTEILAEQHFETMQGFLAQFGVRTGLLTGSMTAKEKNAVKAALAEGSIDLIIGTHALLSENVQFHDLALVITDEQHRFGVDQRAALNNKSASVPHVLVMSATPIPRTLALMLYGDLDISVIDELPPGRQRVDTFLVNESYRARLNSFIRKQVSSGYQVFVICPSVEDNPEFDDSMKSAVEFSKTLSSEVFPDLRVACLHGKMKAKEKADVMLAFSKGNVDILVSTTVVEVGVDVPNASLIIIENAERFGLSQLHQLRGRVGRGSQKSYCVLVSDSGKADTRQRLEALCKTNDGFRISEEDLKLRGPGDFFGSRQHGLPEMKIADLCTDMDILYNAQDAAKEVLGRDPELALPENQTLSDYISKMYSRETGMMN